MTPFWTLGGSGERKHRWAGVMYAVPKRGNRNLGVKIGRGREEEREIVERVGKEGIDEPIVPKQKIKNNPSTTKRRSNYPLFPTSTSLFSSNYLFPSFSSLLSRIYAVT